ncbi:NHL repeat-containing protein [Nostoc sp.]
MINKLLAQFKKLRHKLNQDINKFSKTRYLHRSKTFNFLLSLTVGVIVTSIGITTDWATTETPTLTYKTSWTNNSIDSTNLLVQNNTKTPALTYQTSWIGNTIGSGNLRVQNNIEAMYVAPDGTVYTNSHWDEAGMEAAIYKDGKVIGAIGDTHGWSRGGGKAVTVNSKYIYIAMTQGSRGKTNEDYPPEGTTWHCVRRYDLSGKPAPFLNGRGWDKSMLITSNKSEVTGLATVENELYVSDFAANRIRIYDTDTMKEIRSFTVANPGAITIDPQKNLWIIQSKNGSNPAKILHYSQSGKQLSQQIADIVEPTAIAIAHQGKLLVAENGPRQQMLIYDIKDQPVQVGSFGSKGGIYAEVPGEVRDLKLYGLTGVGTDASGNIYINSDGFNKSGTDLRKFSPSGKLLWRSLGLIFVDNADADPKTDGVDLFTKQEHYLMDFSKPAGKQWTYKAYTLNAFKYPQDPRLHTSPDGTFVRRIQGKPFLFLTDMYSSFLQIYRFNPATDGKVAIPAGMFVGSNSADKPFLTGNWPPHQPKQGEWIWRDRNGNGKFEKNEYDTSKDYPYIGGWWVDSKGDVWKALRTEDGIRHYPLQGIDPKGNPIYSYSLIEKQTTPKIFNDLRRIEYFPETDTMYLSGFTVDHPAFGDDAGVAGSEIARFDNWSKGNRTPQWRIVIPYDTTGKREVSTAAISVAGDRVFAVTVKTAEVYVYNAKTGVQVQQLKPGPEVGSESGWIDIPYGVRTFRRSNGEYLVFVEENWKGKVIMYRLAG